MRTAVIADPHSNLTALVSVLEEMADRGLDDILLAGDLVGYGPDPNEVVRLISAKGITSIRGNHDRASVNREFRGMNPHAASAAEWTSNMLEEKTLDVLRTLPDYLLINLGNRRIGLHHGSPRDPDEYIFNSHLARDFLIESDVDILIVGHTHVPLVAREDEKLFLNPGAVGQPRDGDPKASFAELDLDTLEVEIVRVPYDIGSVQERMRDRALPEFLVRRLELGR